MHTMDIGEMYEDNNNHCEISVIVPCYNVGNYIESLLKSLEEQVFKKFEVLFINDGSTDNTALILNQLCSNLPYKHLIIEKENGGPGSARNVGLEHASGKYVFFVDGDDYLYPHSLSKLIELMTDGVDLAIGAFVDSNDNLRTFPHIENRDKWMSKTMTIGCLTLINKLYRKSIIDKYHLRFDTTIRNGEDHLFTASYLYHCTGKMAVTDYAVYFYNYNPMSISHIISTTKTFSPWIAESVFSAVKIYELLKDEISPSALKELRYDSYHKYRRIRHEAHVQKCRDKLFYDTIYKEIRKIIPVREMVFFGIRRRADIIFNSLKNKILKNVYNKKL